MGKKKDKKPEVSGSPAPTTSPSRDANAANTDTMVAKELTVEELAPEPMRQASRKSLDEDSDPKAGFPAEPIAPLPAAALAEPPASSTALASLPRGASEDSGMSEKGDKDIAPAARLEVSLPRSDDIYLPQRIMSAPLRRASMGATLPSHESRTHDQASTLRTIGPDNARMLRDDELESVCAMLKEAIAVREKYRSAQDRELFHSETAVHPTEDVPDPFEPTPHFRGGHYSFEMVRGVMRVYAEPTRESAGLKPPGKKDKRAPHFAEPPSLDE